MPMAQVQLGGQQKHTLVFYGSNVSKFTKSHAVNNHPYVFVPKSTWSALLRTALTFLSVSCLRFPIHEVTQFSHYFPPCDWLHRLHSCQTSWYHYPFPGANVIINVGAVIVPPRTARVIICLFY